MSQSGHGFLTRDWGDGTHTFRLDWGAWKELHDKCGAGPAELFDRLLTRKWLAQDVFEILRLGLIGGGMSPVEALRNAAQYVKDRPLLESIPVALEIVSASLIGPVDEKPGEAPVAEQESRSASPPSMGTVQ